VVGHRTNPTERSVGLSQYTLLAMVVLLARPQLQLDFHQDIIALVYITLAQQMYEKQYVMECFSGL
jgi:hypothetical protein